MDRERPQPLILNAWLQRFVTDIETANGMASASSNWEEMADLLLSPDGAIWCGGDCTRRLATALDEAVRDLQPLYGQDPTDWRWGDAHHAVFDNPLLRPIPVVNWLAGASVSIPGDDTTLWRGGSGIPGDFQARHGGAYRGIYDLANPERSRFIVTPGQSGNWLSPNAWNLMQDWTHGSTMTIGRVPDPIAATLSLAP